MDKQRTERTYLIFAAWFLGISGVLFALPDNGAVKGFAGSCASASIWLNLR